MAYTRTAAHLADVLRKVLPEVPFASRMVDGERLEAWIAAPPGSRAGALVVSTDRDGNVWVRFAPPHAFYFIDSDAELVHVVRALLSEAALFVVVMEGTAWVETTLVDAGTAPEVGAGQHATVTSWTGQRDWRVIRPVAGVSRVARERVAGSRTRRAGRRRPRSPRRRR